MRREAAKKIGRLAGSLSVKQGLELAHFAVGLDPRWDTDQMILQHLAWGIRKTNWVSRDSSTWVLPFVEGTFERRPVSLILRNVMWEALLQLAQLTEGKSSKHIDSADNQSS